MPHPTYLMQGAAFNLFHKKLHSLLKADFAASSVPDVGNIADLLATADAFSLS